MKSDLETVILAAGSPPAHELPVRLLRGAARLIACDGAWRSALAYGRAPDVVVGDGDSLGGDGREELERRGIAVVIDPEQETNDLCKAFRHALATAEPNASIIILGATGKREDHALGNIFHLLDFAERCAHDGRNVSVTMMTDAGVFEPVLPPGRSWTERCRTGSPVSVFAPFPETEMASEGLVWPLEGLVFDTLWRGTLNRLSSGSFTIQTNRPVLVFRPYAEPVPNVSPSGQREI